MSAADVLGEAAEGMRNEWADMDLLIRPTAFYLAVADWLDAEAAALDAMAAFTGVAAQIEHAVNIRGAALTVSKSADGAISLQADTSTPALAVARAYLGSAS